MLQIKIIYFKLRKRDDFKNSIIPTKNIMYGYPINYEKSKQKDLGTHSNILLVIVKICDLI
jgi:hypothetical protein